MKKEARIQAQKLFLKAQGKITNREIANMVRVNALTVGRWKRDDDWAGKLKEKVEAKAASPGVVRKKAARDEALRLYLDAGGNVTNKELALAVDVSPATISKWKEADQWIDEIQAQPEEEPAEEAEEFTESTDLDMADLASPEQLVHLGKKIDALLAREHLSPAEVADLADAKRNLLEALKVYLAIVREVESFRQ
jgi:uncharacterized protein YjcR